MHNSIHDQVVHSPLSNKQPQVLETSFSTLADKSLEHVTIFQVINPPDTLALFKGLSRRERPAASCISTGNSSGLAVRQCNPVTMSNLSLEHLVYSEQDIVDGDRLVDIICRNGKVPVV